MRQLTFTADDYFDGKPVCALLKKYGCSRRIITKLKDGNNLTVNGNKYRTIDILRKGDRVIITLPDGNNDIVPNDSLNVEIAYEDNDIIIFNKPTFMATHPSLNHYNDTLANFFTAHCPDCVFRSVNRLDRNTSGLCIVAKNRLAAANLAGSGKNHPQKVYYALVGGEIKNDGEIIAPIGRINDSIIRRCVCDSGQYAKTVYKVLKSNSKMSWLEINLETGRTHQIRVHFSYIGHSLLGDEMYDGDLSYINRQALHCGRVDFIHPVSNKRISITAEPPDDIQKILKTM